MIPNRSADVQVTNNIDSDQTGQFTVDEASLGKIMSVLTNLYSDPEMAVVREYLTNAYDSQVDSGMVLDKNWRPIEVTTPSHFSKEYRVRDFGLGLSVDDIKEVYSKYGKSTKENSNDVTGMLGLGSKCALTYTGQFTITGYKNGVRVRAVVSKDDNDIPVFMIVDTRATDEPNGVEISVPVRDRNSFADKAAQFLKFWPAGSVLLNGNPPRSHALTLVRNESMTFNIAGKDITADVPVYIQEDDGRGYGRASQSYIIMGNVPYAVDAEHVDSNLREAGLGFVAFLPMGAVDFPPSREKLFYNARSKAAVKSVSAGLFMAMLDQRLKEITDAPDHRTAWKRYTELDYHFRSHSKVSGIKYKGLSFVDSIRHENMCLSWDWQGHGQIAERSLISVGALMRNGGLIVTGVTQGTKPTPTFKKKVNHYIESNSLNSGTVLLVEKDTDSEWLKWVPRIDADTIKNLKLPKSTTPTQPRTDAPYDWYMFDSAATPRGVACGSDVTVNVPTGRTLVYISPQDIRETYRRAGTNPDTLASMLGEDYVLVVLGKNRFEKFLRTHTAITVETAIQNRINSLVTSLTDTDYLVGRLSYGEEEFMKSVKPADIHDKDIAALATAVQANKAGKSNYQKAEVLASFASRAGCRPTLPEPKKSVTNPCKRYPLIDRNGGRNISHMVIYVNACYDALVKPTLP